MFEGLQDKANADPNVRRLGRTCTADFMLMAGDAAFHVSVAAGLVTGVSRGPFKMRSAASQVAASDAAWARFMTPKPPPGFHDIFAMSATGAARIEGDMAVLLGHLGFFKALIASLRQEA